MGLSARFDKKSRVLRVLLSISFGFTVFFFTPAELFIRNQADFMADAAHIILPMLVTALVMSAGIFLLLSLSLLIHRTLYTVVSRITAGLLFSFYIQELFLNGNMTALTGAALEIPEWKKYLDSVLMYVITVLPLILVFCAERYPDQKIFKIGNGYAIPYLASAVFVMQACGLVSSAAQYGINTYGRDPERYLSYEPATVLSEEQNIIVFLVDRLDGLYMDELLECYPELYEEFDGFTFYRNNVSHYTNTFPSVTNMFTGALYEGETWDAYFQRAWSGGNALDELKAHGFRVNLYLDQPVTCANLEDVAARCDNIERLMDEDYHFNYIGTNGIVPTMTKLSLGKLISDLWKPVLYDSISTDFSNQFIVFREEIPQYAPGAVGAESDLKFYDYIREHPLTVGGDKSFTFVHLKGCHDPVEELAALYDGPEKWGSFRALRTARGDFEILFEYFSQMKALGVYDNSTVIVLGDHGHPPDEKDRFFTQLDAPITTALLIKPAHADRVRLQFDDASELSNDYFAASILEYAGIAHSDYGYSYRDIAEQDIHAERYLQCLQWLRVGSVEMNVLYEITGDARDFENWTLVEHME